MRHQVINESSYTRCIQFIINLESVFSIRNEISGNGKKSHSIKFRLKNLKPDFSLSSIRIKNT